LAADVADRLLQPERLVAHLAVVEYEINGEGERTLVLRELAPGVSIHQVVEAIGVPMRIPPELIRPGSSL
jgi:acyl CoA:acetate/3-ketoacid CoA transferase beta subunit